MNDLILKSKGKKDFRITIIDRSGRERELRWWPVDMTGVLPYDQMREDRFYCPQRNDGTHLRSEYLEEFLKKLKLQVVAYSRLRQRYKSKHKQK